MEQALEIIQTPVRKELTYLENVFRASLHSEIPLIEEICDSIRNVPGKRLRPVILFLISKSLDGPFEETVTAGLGVELIHTATLVHDDIIDRHMTRRGRATTYSTWGNEIATIIGDFIYSKAFACLGEEGLFNVMEILSRASNIMSMGEMMQFQQSRNIYLSEEGYLDLIYRKTASLFSASGECGVAVSGRGAGSDERNAYSFYGENLGLSFQITDDLFDYIALDETIGKPVASDFSEGRVTLPFISAFRNAPESKKRRVSELFLVDFNKDLHWNEVVSFVQDYGGVEYSLKKARELGDTAKDSLSNMESSVEKDALCFTVDYVVERIKDLL